MGFDPAINSNTSGVVTRMEQSVARNYGDIITRTEMDSMLNAIAPDYIDDIIQQTEEVEQPTDEQVNGNQENELPF